MGQQSSIQEYLSNNLTKLLSDNPSYTITSEEICSMTYEDFLCKLGELNKLSKTCLDVTGNQLLFAVKRGTESSLFWKATVQIACVKLDPQSQKVHTYRLLNLKEFLQVARTLECQNIAAEQSKISSGMSVSSFYQNLDEIAKGESQVECCICLERKMDVLLPCTHSYCLQCIEEWNEDHRTCPICRESLNSTDDTWVLSEVPRAEEISEEIRATLMDLAVEKPAV